MNINEENVEKFWLLRKVLEDCEKQDSYINSVYPIISDPNLENSLTVNDLRAYWYVLIVNHDNILNDLREFRDMYVSDDKNKLTED